MGEIHNFRGVEFYRERSRDVVAQMDIIEKRDERVTQNCSLRNWEAFKNILKKTHADLIHHLMNPSHIPAMKNEKATHGLA